MVNPQSSPVDVAARFAAALDRDDFDGAAELLMSDCVYQFEGDLITGREAIIETYRRNGEWARSTFDRIDYESLIEIADDGRACITFIDDIQHAGQCHQYRCQQLVSVNAWGLIESIEHVEIENERPALEAFLERVGVRRG